MAGRAKRDAEGIYIQDGSYWLQWRGRRSLGIRVPDKESARIAAREFKRRAIDPAYQSAASISLEKACSEWRDSLVKPNAETLKMYAAHLGHFMRLMKPATALASVDSTLVDAYLKARRAERTGRNGRTTKENTLSKEIGTLRRVLRFAARRGWYTRPIDSVLPDNMSNDYKPLKRALTEEQIAPFLEAVGGAGVGAGANGGPGSELGWARAATCCFVIAFGADAVCIPRARLADFREPDGSLAVAVYIRGSKNDHRSARVPIVEPFVELAARARHYLEAHGSFPAWVNSTRDLEAACRRAGVPRVTLRDLRRSAGRILRARGTPPALIAPFLRHADSRMAERVYAGIEPEDLRRQIEATGAGGAATDGAD